MKLTRAISTAILSLTLGVGISAYAQEQHEQHEQEENRDKPAQEKEKKAQPEKSAKPEQKSAQPERSTKPEERDAQGHAQQARPEQQAQHAHANRGRIPDDRYKAHFGSEHTFRVSQGDYRNHRFQYGGYWFGFAAPWPSNWLYTQDVFVVEIDGAYYLCNANYPGVNIALNVIL